MALEYDGRIPMFSVKPTHITFFTEPINRRPRRELLATQAKQPNSNRSGRELSVKASKRLKTGINWLVEFAKVKRVLNEKTNKFIFFKVNFITLTLPALQAHLDETIKNKVFNNWLTVMRKQYGMKNYVWRAEPQSNGSIHIHIVTDSYINYYVIRTTWNRLLRPLGYIDKYHDKFTGLTFENYRKLVDPSMKRDLSSLTSAYEYGNKSNWKDPNTTDVHSVKNVENLAAYCAKYMSKGLEIDEDQDSYTLKQRKIKGRLWGCSHSISRCKGFVDMTNEVVGNLFDYAVNHLKCEVIVDQYYQVLLVSMKDWRKEFGSLYREIIGFIKDCAEYESGGIGTRTYNLK